MSRRATASNLPPGYDENAGSGADGEAPAGGLLTHAIAELGGQGEDPFGLGGAVAGQAARGCDQGPLAQRQGRTPAPDEVGPHAEEVAPEEADIVADRRVGGDGTPRHPPAGGEERADRCGLEASRKRDRQRQDVGGRLEDETPVGGAAAMDAGGGGAMQRRKGGGEHVDHG